MNRMKKAEMCQNVENLLITLLYEKAAHKMFVKLALVH
jgi:hypothetical protein